MKENHIKKAYFSMGCFWKMEALFDSLNGVVKTYVGYTGGSTLLPTYNSIGDHLETLEIYYDCNKINFEDLLTVFEKNHNYTVRPNLLQYNSAIFYNNENEKEIALIWKANKEKELNKRNFNYNFSNRKILLCRILSSKILYSIRTCNYFQFKVYVFYWQ